MKTWTWEEKNSWAFWQIKAKNIIVVNSNFKDMEFKLDHIITYMIFMHTIDIVIYFTNCFKIWVKFLAFLFSLLKLNKSVLNLVYTLSLLVYDLRNIFSSVASDMLKRSFKLSPLYWCNVSHTKCIIFK